MSAPNKELVDALANSDYRARLLDNDDINTHVDCIVARLEVDKARTQKGTNTVASLLSYSSDIRYMVSVVDRAEFDRIVAETAGKLNEMLARPHPVAKIAAALSRVPIPARAVPPQDPPF